MCHCINKACVLVCECSDCWGDIITVFWCTDHSKRTANEKEFSALTNAPKK